MKEKTLLRKKIEEKMDVLCIKTFREVCDRVGIKENTLYALVSRTSAQIFEGRAHTFWINNLFVFLKFTVQDLIDLDSRFSFQTATEYLKKGGDQLDDSNCKTVYTSGRYLTEEDVEFLSHLAKSPKKLTLRVAFELLKST